MFFKRREMYKSSNDTGQSDGHHKADGVPQVERHEIDFSGLMRPGAHEYSLPKPRIVGEESK